MNPDKKIPVDYVAKPIPKGCGFIVTNRRGSYFSEGISSRYSGFFCNLDSEMYRIIDSIESSEEPKKTIKTLIGIRKSYDLNDIDFFIPHGYDVLCCVLKKEQSLTINFDIRKSYDLRTWGKNYNIYEEEDHLIIEYTKKTDSREDDSNNNEEFKIYVVISGVNVKYKLPDKWVKKSYSFDKARGSDPSEMHVYQGLQVLSREVILSVSKDKKEAIKKVEEVKENLSKLVIREKETAESSFMGIKDKKVSLAFNFARENMKDLSIKEKNPGVFAGLPWFFQYWMRDEAICLKALMLMKEYELCNKILFRQLESLGEDGKIPNRIPAAGLATADATGWMFKRIGDLRDSLKDKNLKKKYFAKFFEGYAKGQIEKSLKLLYQNSTSSDADKFALNGPQETWMDTVWDGDNREGARIEIQALRLAKYKLAYELSGKQMLKELEIDLKKKVKDKFWNGKYLADGLDDWTIRPNLFIAAYIYPELLTKKEWKTCFDNVLPKLWLDWGGLSTIDKGSSIFVKNYTGEVPQSYHRGDSWFWINNLAALVMARVDKKYFKKYIDRIVDASVKDILSKGLIGCHSELSSASVQKAEGSLSQAWSSAMFIELIYGLYDLK